jgi:hypothetical protein
MEEPLGKDSQLFSNIDQLHTPIENIMPDIIERELLGEKTLT